MTEGEKQMADMDLDKEIECPICNILMQQIMVSKQNYAVMVDRCNRCEGYWFDRYELEKVIEEGMKVWTLQFEDAHEDEAKFRCPRCEGLMETKNLYNIEVDLCLMCGGIWLDKGELEAVQKTYRIEQNQIRVLGVLQEALES